MPNGQSALPSWPGFIITILMSTILLTYGTLEFINLKRNDGSLIFSYTISNNVTSSYEFDLDKNNGGFQLAFGFTDRRDYLTEF